MTVRRRYVLVRVIAWILKALGWIALVLGILGGVLALTNLNANGTFIRVLSSVGMVAGPVAGILWWVVFYAFGSVLAILVDIEENTRLLAAEPPATTSVIDTR